MNSHYTPSYNKNNLIMRNVTKNNNKKKYFSSRSNTQDKPHNNINIKSLSTNKPKKNRNSINNIIKNEQIPKKYTNITSSLNSENTNKNNSHNYKYKINQNNEIINQKDMEIFELEKKVKLYTDKLNFLKKNKNIYNINISINSFNLSKTRSSSNVTERNIYFSESLSKSQAKIKIPSSFQEKNENKKRPKSNNYRKPKMDFYNINKYSINYKKNKSNKSKYVNLNENNILFNTNKRRKSSNVKIQKIYIIL
jgi:hypothetical protein